MKKRIQAARRKAVAVWALVVGVLFLPGRALAAGMDTVDKTQAFVLDLIGTAGVIFIGLGVLNLALAMQSHDESQRGKAILAIVGGAIMVSIRFVLDALGVAHQ